MNRVNKRRVSISVPPDDYNHLQDLADRFGSSLDAIGSKLALLGLQIWEEDPSKINFCPCKGTCPDCEVRSCQ
jgi:hypothetical protein